MQVGPAFDFDRPLSGGSKPGSGRTDRLGVLFDSPCPELLTLMGNAGGYDERELVSRVLSIYAEIVPGYARAAGSLGRRDTCERHLRREDLAFGIPQTKRPF